jgi:hypothetical protein
MSQHPGTELDPAQQSLHKAIGICKWCGNSVLAQERVDDPVDVCYTCFVKGALFNMRKSDEKRKAQSSDQS